MNNTTRPCVLVSSLDSQKDVYHPILSTVVPSTGTPYTNNTVCHLLGSLTLTRNRGVTHTLVTEWVPNPRTPYPDLPHNHNVGSDSFPSAGLLTRVTMCAPISSPPLLTS